MAVFELVVTEQLRAPLLDVSSWQSANYTECLYFHNLRWHAVVAEQNHACLHIHVLLRKC